MGTQCTQLTCSRTAHHDSAWLITIITSHCSGARVIVATHDTTPGTATVDHSPTYTYSPQLTVNSYKSPAPAMLLPSHIRNCERPRLPSRQDRATSTERPSPPPTTTVIPVAVTFIRSAVICTNSSAVVGMASRVATVSMSGPLRSGISEQ
eukprot:scpid100654/ scgid10190/ 